MLAKALELLGDLHGELANVSQHKDRHLTIHWLDLVQCGKYEHSSLAHSTLGLAKHVVALDRLWDALALHYKRT